MKKKNIFISLMFGLLMGSCSLDYENTSAITPDGVWENPDMVNAF